MRPQGCEVPSDAEEQQAYLPPQQELWRKPWELYPPGVEAAWQELWPEVEDPRNDYTGTWQGRSGGDKEPPACLPDLHIPSVISV